MVKILVLCVVCFGIAQIASANDSQLRQIPSEFKLTNLSGEETNYAGMTGEQGAILIFSRSLDWCPYCIAQAKEWSAFQPAIRQAGYRLAMVTYDSVERLKRAKQKYALGYDLYADIDSKMIKALGILNEGYKGMEKVYGVPYPTIFVVNSVGEITHHYARSGYKKRPDPQNILQKLGISLAKAPVASAAP